MDPVPVADCARPARRRCDIGTNSTLAGPPWLRLRKEASRDRPDSGVVVFSSAQTRFHASRARVPHEARSIGEIHMIFRVRDGRVIEHWQLQRNGTRLVESARLTRATSRSRVRECGGCSAAPSESAGARRCEEHRGMPTGAWRCSPGHPGSTRHPASMAVPGAHRTGPRSARSSRNRSTSGDDMARVNACMAIREWCRKRSGRSSRQVARRCTSAAMIASTFARSDPAANASRHGRPWSSSSSSSSRTSTFSSSRAKASPTVAPPSCPQRRLRRMTLGPGRGPSFPNSRSGPSTHMRRRAGQLSPDPPTP